MYSEPPSHIFISDPVPNFCQKMSVLASTDSISQSPSPKETPSKSDLYQRPWQYLGYRAFCEWSSSDDDLFILRRFKTLNTRILLRMQDSIVQLEDELNVLDVENSQLGCQPVNNGSHRHDMIERREEILIKIQAELKEYNEYITKYSELRSRQPAEEHERLNVENWLLRRFSDAIFPAESEYITKKDDLIRVVPGKKSPLVKMMEKCSLITGSIFFRKQAVKEGENTGYDPESLFYYHDDSLESCARAGIILCGLIMLVAPPWWLLLVQDKTKQLAIITGFIVLFLALLATLSAATPFESLAATAAYSAVLMVFMQVGNGA